MTVIPVSRLSTPELRLLGNNVAPAVRQDRQPLVDPYDAIFAPDLAGLAPPKSEYSPTSSTQD